jgi:hypothetical protein
LTSSFLLNFSTKLITRLDEQGHIQLSASRDEVIQHVAGHLGGLSQGRSLISELVNALLVCPGIEELFADDDTLKQCLEDLQH